MVVVIGRLQQRAWTADDGSAQSAFEVVTEELGPTLRWAAATPSRRRGRAEPEVCLAVNAIVCQVRRCDRRRLPGVTPGTDRPWRECHSP